MGIKGYENLRIAIVHDFLVQWGGAERVLEEISDMFPEAPIYTLLHNREYMHGMFENKDIRCSYLQKFPKFLRKHYKLLFPFFLVLPETFDFRDYDIVISSSGAWSKGIVTKLSTTHIAYIHSPMRFVWDYNERYLKESGKKHVSIITRWILTYARIWDRLAADRPDYLIANSVYTQRRIHKYYRRQSTVLYPPAEFRPISGNHDKNIILPFSDYFLVVSRLSPYKKVDMVIEAFNKLELPLIVVGSGKQLKYLKSIAKKNIYFAGWCSDEDLQQYYSKARAFIFPADDDFGMTAVEAMTQSVPVIALRSGGACETMIEGVTGEFFDSQTPEVLADGVRRFLENESAYDRKAIALHAQKFSSERFREGLENIIKSIIETQSDK